MLHLATEADLPAIRTFLAPRVATSMFLSGNLRDYGMGAGLASDHPKSVTLWYSRAAGEIVNVFGYVKAGFFIFEAPAFSTDLASPLRRALLGRSLRSLNGAASQVEAVVAALDLPVAGAALDEVEPHYRLKLADLREPGGDSQLRPATLADLDLLGDWRMASEVESLGLTDTPENRSRGRATLQEVLMADRVRILVLDCAPVAMTAFNAALPSIVQVGGVYTPLDVRCSGHARRAVALHLAEAQQAGITEATLFAANPAAARAYEAIGFCRIGSYRIVNFDPAIRIGGPS